MFKMSTRVLSRNQFFTTSFSKEEKLDLGGSTSWMNLILIILSNLHIFCPIWVAFCKYHDSFRWLCDFSIQELCHREIFTKSRAHDEVQSFLLYFPSSIGLLFFRNGWMNLGWCCQACFYFSRPLWHGRDCTIPLSNSCADLNYQNTLWIVNFYLFNLILKITGIKLFGLEHLIAI